MPFIKKENHLEDTIPEDYDGENESELTVEHKCCRDIAIKALKKIKKAQCDCKQNVSSSESESSSDSDDTDSSCACDRFYDSSDSSCDSSCSCNSSDCSCSNSSSSSTSESDSYKLSVLDSNAIMRDFFNKLLIGKKSKK